MDDTNLLYYHARYYDPVLARFISADSVVPGSASGSMDSVALKPLTVDFHEPGFVSTLHEENQRGFWFQLSAEERAEVGTPWGPANPQALNRYSYVLNNPLRWTDPTGHCPGPWSVVCRYAGPIVRGIGQQATRFGRWIGTQANRFSQWVSSQIHRAPTLPFQSGDIIRREYKIPQGTVKIAARVNIEGKTLHLKDFAFWEVNENRIGATAVRDVFRQLAEEAKALGFEKLHIAGTRFSGANPGKKAEFWFDLTQ